MTRSRTILALAILLYLVGCSISFSACNNAGRDGEFPGDLVKKETPKDSVKIVQVKK